MNILNRIKQEPYIKVNLICAGIILLMLVYFGIFSAVNLNYPIHSMYNELVPSTGLSRSFSAILRLNFSEANTFNPYGLHLFMFFLIQLLLRIMFSFFLLYNSLAKKVVLIYDIVISGLLFLATFGVYMVNQMNNLYA